jgi:hypothetical protein
VIEREIIMIVDTCLFCNNIIENFHNGESKIYYECKRCGIVQLTEEAYSDFVGENFSSKDKNIISIVLRNEYEMTNQKPPQKYLKLGDLKLIIDQYSPLDPLAKMDNALINIARESKYVGEIINIDPKVNYSYYHCFNDVELNSVLEFLAKADYINSSLNEFGKTDVNIYITAKGYERLREIERLGKDSKQCFVAIWFTHEMNDVYKNAIKPAIEFIERGESIPRYEAVKIDNVEHINDINDEIIAQIRRSRFMVCDLTGYRGGVYFEAGFAYGLGLDVIYTCREDWCKEQKLLNEKGEEVKVLYDENKNEIPIKKEGVHFDLAHRNRIEWSPDKPDDFRKKLQERIKAIIV